jgi:hypothetical protein
LVEVLEGKLKIETNEGAFAEIPQLIAAKISAAGYPPINRKRRAKLPCDNSLSI